MASSVFSHFPIHIRYGFFIVIMAFIWGPLYYTSSTSIPPLEPITDVLVYKSTLPSADLRKNASAQQLPIKFSEFYPDDKALMFEIKVNLAPLKEQMYALYVPWLTGNAGAFVNDVAVLDKGAWAYTPVLSRYPLLIDIHPTMLTAGENRISIMIEGEFVGEGRLEPVYFATKQSLKPYWGTLYFHKVQVVHLLSAMLFLLILFALFTHVFIKHDTLYLWFFAAGCAWIVTNEIYLIVHFPAPEAVRRSLFAIANLVNISILPIFARRYMNFASSRLERFYLIFAVIETTSIGLMVIVYPLEVRSFVEAYIRIRALLCVVYIFTQFLFYIRSGSAPASLLSLWLISLVVASMTFPLHTVISYFTGFSLVPSNYFLTGSIHLILVFVTIYISRVYDLFASLVSLNHELDDKVRSATQEVEKRHIELQNLRQKQILVKERSRIMQDIHDGVAGHLVAALAIAQRSEQTDDRVVELMQTSVTDLRLVVDSLESNTADLNQLLEKFRSRIEPLFLSTGIGLKWSVALPENINLNADQLLSVYRCLQEAVTNIVRHANADNVTIKGWDEQVDYAVISVSDDGDAKQGGIIFGTGLNNIHQRMIDMGGRAELVQGSEQQFTTQLQLWLPKVQGR